VTVAVWILRLLVVLIVLRVVFRALKGAGTIGSRTRQRIGGTLVRDPQCGTFLPPARALSLSTRTGVVHFCSDRCRDTWVSSHS